MTKINKSLYNEEKINTDNYIQNRNKKKVINIIDIKYGVVLRNANR